MALKFGLVGTGHWARNTHAAAFAAHPDAVLAAVWGRDPAKAEVIAARFGARAYVRLDDLLSEVDAVAIAVPPDVQPDVAVRAAEAGRHLLLDKPLALTTEAADRVVTAVESAGIASVVFFTSRFHSNVDAFLRDAPKRGFHGARVTMFRSIFQPGSPYAGSQWRAQMGGLWDLGPHALAHVLPVFGPVERVVAMRGRHAAVHVLLGHGSGAVSSLALTLDAPAGGTLLESLFYGPDGVVPVPAGNGNSVSALAAAISQLAALAVTGGTEHPCDVRFAREAVGVLAAADASARAF